VHEGERSIGGVAAFHAGRGSAPALAEHFHGEGRPRVGGRAEDYGAALREHAFGGEGLRRGVGGRGADTHEDSAGRDKEHGDEDRPQGSGGGRQGGARGGEGDDGGAVAGARGLADG